MSRLKENVITLYTIIRREIVRFFRIWTQTLVPPVVTMGLYFIIFGNLIGSRIGSMGGAQYIEYIVPGLIMMSMITNAYANVVGSFFVSKFQRNLEELLVSPASNVVIIWGYVLGGVARGVMVGILVTVASLFFTKLTIAHVGLTFLIGILTVMLFSMAGLINGIFAKKFDDINVVPTFILTPLSYLGGTFYSISVLSEFWKKLSYVNPVFYMVNGFRYAILGYSDVDILWSLSVVTVLIFFSYLFCLRLLNTGTGIRT